MIFSTGVARKRSWDFDVADIGGDLEGGRFSDLIHSMSKTEIIIRDQVVGLDNVVRLTGTFSWAGSTSEILDDRIENAIDSGALKGSVSAMEVGAYQSSGLFEASAVFASINTSLSKLLMTSLGFSSFLSGNDVINGNDYLNDQDDVPAGKWQDDYAGNSFNGNRLHGFSGNDTVNGGQYVDSLWGDDGNDTLNGKDGSDFLYGGNGNDRLSGDSGDDLMSGDSGKDTLAGGDGNDYLIGGAGGDSIDGGDGVRDVVSFEDKVLSVKLTLAGSKAATATVGRLKEDIVKNVEGVTGGSGADTLGGDALDNFLAGWNGKDTLTGGAGADVFILSGKNITAADADVITDFDSAQGDMIALDESTGIEFDPDTDAAMFKSGAGLQSSTGSEMFIYNTDTGQFYYDPEGSAGAGPFLLARLIGAPPLTAADLT